MPMMNPPQPGLSVRYDCLEPFKLSVTEAVRELGIGQKQLSGIENCRSGISPEMAIRPEQAFGGGADAWYRFQATHEMTQAMKTANQMRETTTEITPMHTTVSLAKQTVVTTAQLTLWGG